MKKIKTVRREFDEIIKKFSLDFHKQLFGKIDTPKHKEISEELWFWIQEQIEQGQIDVLENCLYVYRHLPQTNGVLEKSLQTKLIILKNE